MADEYTITTRSEGLLGHIGRWGAALITDEELLEAVAVHDAEKRAEWEAEQGEPEWGVGWSATWSSRVMGFPLPSREEAEAHVRESNADPDDDVRYFLVQRTPEREPGWWLPVPDTTNHETTGANDV